MKRSTLRAVDGVPMIVRDFRAEKDKTTGLLPPMLAADGTPVTITLLGMDSPVARDLHYARAASARNRVEARLQQITAGVTPESAPLTAEDIAAEDAADLDMLVALTTAWHGFEEDDGTPSPFTPDAVRETYQLCPPIREQALAFIGDRSRFFGDSKPTPAPSPSTSSD